MPTPVLLIHGTWGAEFAPDGDPDWWQPGSPLARLFACHGLDAGAYDPFVWTGDLSGLARIAPWNWFRSNASRDWQAEGQALRYVLEPRGCPVPFASRNLVAHSHGGQGVFYAAAAGVKIRRLITVSTPVRGDMEKVVAAARPNIERWLHVYDPRKLADRYQVLGELGDGRLGWRRSFTQADVNVSIPGVGHTGLLTEPEWFPKWESHGLISFLRDERVAEAA